MYAMSTASAALQLQHYQQISDAAPANSTQAFNSYHALKEQCIRLDLRLTLKDLSSLPASAATLPELQSQFVAMMRKRMSVVNGTLLSPWLNPRMVVNECCREIFKCLFPEATFFVYIQTLSPEVKKILILEEALDERKQVTAVFRELPFNEKNAQAFLIENECLVVDQWVIPLAPIIRHSDTITTHGSRINQRNQLFAGILKLLLDSRYNQVFQSISANPLVKELFTKVQAFINGLTLREAITHFKNALMTSSLHNTGTMIAPPQAEKALAEFQLYLDTFPEKVKADILQNVLVNGDAIKNLANVLQKLTSGPQCVKEAAEWLEGGLANKKNERWLNLSSLLDETDKQKLKKEIHEYWKDKKFTWSTSDGVLPSIYLNKLCANLTFDYVEEVTDILFEVTHFQTYLALLNHPGIPVVTRNHLREALFMLSDEQTRYLFLAMTDSADAMLKFILPRTTLRSILQGFRASQIAIVLETLHTQILKFIHQETVLKNMLTWLPYGLYAKTYEAIGNTLSTSITSLNDYDDLIAQISDPELIIKMLLPYFTKIIPTLEINNIDVLRKVFQMRAPVEIQKICEVHPDIPNLMASISVTDIWNIIHNLPFEEQTIAACKGLEAHLIKIINSKKKIDQLLDLIHQSKFRDMLFNRSILQINRSILQKVFVTDQDQAHKMIQGMVIQAERSLIRMQADLPIDAENQSLEDFENYFYLSKVVVASFQNSINTVNELGNVLHRLNNGGSLRTGELLQDKLLTLIKSTADLRVLDASLNEDQFNAFCESFFKKITSGTFKHEITDQWKQLLHHPLLLSLQKSWWILSIFLLMIFINLYYNVPPLLIYFTLACMLASILIPTIRESLIISATQSYVSDIQKNCHDLLTQPTTWSPKFLSTTMNKAENESINGLIGLLNTNKHDLFQQLIHINAFAHQYPDIFDLIKSRMSLVRSESPEVNVENQALVLRVPALHA